MYSPPLNCIRVILYSKEKGRCVGCHNEECRIDTKRFFSNSTTSLLKNSYWPQLMMQLVQNVFCVVLIQRIVYFAAFAAEEESLSRSAYFTTRENKRLQGYVVERFESPSLISCSQLCLRNSWCTSTNFKMSFKKDDKGTCELNKHDISVINENTEFHDKEDVTFSLLLKVSFGFQWKLFYW